MPTIREGLVAWFEDQLATIRIANGFQTDAGQKVFAGEAPELGESDPEAAMALLLEDEETLWQRGGTAAIVKLPFTISAIAKADLEAPWRTVEQVLSDVRKAVEIEDRTLGGILNNALERTGIRTLKREAGSTTVGVAVTYTATFKEGWGTP